MQKNLRSRSLKLKSSLLLACTLLFPACGRKPKQLFSRQETRSTLKTSRLTLPAVQDVSATQLGHVTWETLPQDITPLPRPHERVTLGPEPKLLGYNVYRFADGGFVPKDSLNDEPVTTTTYRDLKDRGTHTWHYLVRGVFLVSGRIVEGPMSQIA